MRRFAAIAACFLASAALAQTDPRPPGITTQGVGIQDMKHQRSLVAGDTYDNHVYHQSPNGRPNAQWRLDPVGDGSFFITDLKHGKCLVAGDGYDGRVYHQDHGWRMNARWKFVANGDGSYTLYDMKHGKALVAGDAYDQNVYHQDPNGRLNAKWTIIAPTSQVTATAPANGTIQWPDGALCPPACSKTLLVGSTATLKATPAATFGFVQWSGGTCSGSANPCTFTVAAGGSQTIGASFGAPAVSANGRDVIRSGEVLRTNERIVSPNGRYFVRMNGDGRLCEGEITPGSASSYGYEFWCNGVIGAAANGPNFTLFVGADGNMCERQGHDESGGTNLWCTNKIGASGGAFAKVSDDGTFAVYSGTPSQPGASLWQNDLARLTVTPPAAGGSIRWKDGSLCPGTCTKALGVGFSVELTAVASPNVVFTGWTGSAGCAGRTNPCLVTVAAGGAQSVGATFVPLPPSANGSSIITTGQILFPNESLVSSDASSKVTLQNTGALCITRNGQSAWCSPASTVGQYFATVQGNGSVCVVPGEFGEGRPPLWCSPAGATQAAYFAEISDGVLSVFSGTPASRGAKVWAEGARATITVARSAGGLIYCGDLGGECRNALSCGNLNDVRTDTSCSYTALRGTTVQLIGVPALGWVFSGWGDACPGTSVDCNVTMTDRTVTPVFTNVGIVTLSISPKPTDGQIWDNQGPGIKSVILCGTNMNWSADLCSHRFTRGARVRLIPRRRSDDRTWVGTWGTGACATENQCVGICNNHTECILVLDTDKRVDATW